MILIIIFLMVEYFLGSYLYYIIFRDNEPSARTRKEHIKITLLWLLPIKLVYVGVNVLITWIEMFKELK